MFTNIIKNIFCLLWFLIVDFLLPPVSIASIKEVRGGKTTEALKNKEIAGIYQDECAFSVIFGEEFESMDLIANTPDEANIWITGLTCLINTSAKVGTCKL